MSEVDNNFTAMDAGREIMAEKQRKRYLLLDKLYRVTGGSQRKIVFFPDHAKEEGIDEAEAFDILDYLVGQGLVKSVADQGAVIITHRGIVEIEQSKEHPNEPTDHFPTQIIQHFNAPVGAVQTGGQSVANVSQNDPDEEEMFEITVALAQAMRDGTGNLIEFETGTREFRLAERMVERGKLERLAGVPGYYILPTAHSERN